LLAVLPGCEAGEAAGSRRRSRGAGGPFEHGRDPRRIVAHRTLAAENCRKGMYILAFAVYHAILPSAFYAILETVYGACGRNLASRLRARAIDFPF